MAIPLSMIREARSSSISLPPEEKPNPHFLPDRKGLNPVGPPNYCHHQYVDRTQVYCQTFIVEASEVIRARICKNCYRWDVTKAPPKKD